MLAAIFAGLSLATLWYINFLKPQVRRRALKGAIQTYFLVPLKAQHACSYANQDDEEHILKQISVPPNSELVVDLVMHIKVPISYSEWHIGFAGEMESKPYFSKYSNRYIAVGKGTEVDPSLKDSEDFIDKHFYYHVRRGARSISAGTVISAAFTIKTRAAGLYPLRVIFVSEEDISEEASIFVCVESKPTLKVLCVDPSHKLRPCSQGVLAIEQVDG
jgi:hypothetical protein